MPGQVLRLLAWPSSLIAVIFALWLGWLSYHPALRKVQELKQDLLPPIFLPHPFPTVRSLAGGGTVSPLFILEHLGAAGKRKHVSLRSSLCLSSFPNKQKSAEPSPTVMSSSLGSNLSELDRLLLELNAVQHNAPGFPTGRPQPGPPGSPLRIPCMAPG